MSAIAGQMRKVLATRYVTPLREGGSLPGLMEAEDDGLYVVKFRGAGQGTLALISEVIVGELARDLGLPVPETLLVEIDASIADAEADPEIQELIHASAGLNFGMDFLPGAFPFAPPIDRELAAKIVWLDAFTANVDRTAKNPNLLSWHNRTWLIDHGAALLPQHSDEELHLAAPRPFPMIANHVLLPFADRIESVHEEMSGKINAEMLTRICSLFPEDWLKKHRRQQYVEYLIARLKNAGFVQEADRARP